MNAASILNELGGDIYQPPLSEVRCERDYPDLANPLHLTVLLIDCDTEVVINGMLGFLENLTGRNIQQTKEALQLIGATKHAALLDLVQDCMTKHGVTWERLRGDFEGTAEYQITSFHQLHGEELEVFGQEVCSLTRSFSLFNEHNSTEDVHGGLCRYLDDRLTGLRQEIDKRKTPSAASNDGSTQR